MAKPNEVLKSAEEILKESNEATALRIEAEAEAARIEAEKAEAEKAEAARIEAEKAEAEKAEAARIEAEKAEADVVVCSVKKRYSIALSGGGSVTYSPGHITMPREHAEHWYSIANETAILGIPDNGDLKGAGAKARFAKIVSDLEALSSALVAFKADHAGLAVEQTEMLDKASKFLAGAKKLLGEV